MRTILVLLLVLAISDTSVATDQKLVILHTNDLHSKLMGFAPESEYSPLTINDDNTRGGFARIASIISEQKEQHPENTLVLDAGDFTMGSLFHTLEEQTGFQLQLMHQMGYDALTLGNHEFDYGPASLANMILNASKNGEIPELLLANLEFSKKSPGDDKLDSLYQQGLIKGHIMVEKRGMKIGIIGLMGNNAMEVAPAARPAVLTNPVKATKNALKALRQQGVDMVICLSHGGIYGSEKKGWAGDDAELARKVKGLDIIISGHTHTYLEKPALVNGTYIVQTGSYGKNVGKLEIFFNGSGITKVNGIIIPVDDQIKGDAKIQALVDKQKKLITEGILEQLGLSYEKPVFESSAPLAVYEYKTVESSPLGQLLADANRYYINQHDQVDIAFVAAGMVRDKIYKGTHTAADIFRISSLGNGKDNIPGYPLAKVYLTGREIKNVIELILMTYPPNPGAYCYYSNLSFYFHPGNGFLKKIDTIRFGNHRDGYEPFDIDKKSDQLYSIAASSYLLEFFGQIKKKTFGLVKIVPKDANGRPLENFESAIIDFDQEKEGIQEGKEWIALVEYARSFEDMDGNGIPDVPGYYLDFTPTIKVVKE